MAGRKNGGPGTKVAVTFAPLIQMKKINGEIESLFNAVTLPVQIIFRLFGQPGDLILAADNVPEHA